MEVIKSGVVQLPLTLLDADLIAAKTMTKTQQQQQQSFVSSSATLNQSSAQTSFPRLRVVNSTIREADVAIRVHADENEMPGAAAASKMSERRRSHHRRPLSAARKPLADITDAFSPSLYSLSSTHILDSSARNSASSRKRQISAIHGASESCSFLKPSAKRSRSSVSSLR